MPKFLLIITAFIGTLFAYSDSWQSIGEGYCNIPLPDAEYPLIYRGEIEESVETPYFYRIPCSLGETPLSDYIYIHCEGAIYVSTFGCDELIISQRCKENDWVGEWCYGAKLDKYNTLYRKSKNSYIIPDQCFSYKTSDSPWNYVHSRGGNPNFFLEVPNIGDANMKSGVYFGITAFNHLPKIYNIDLLESNKKTAYYYFVNTLSMDDYTFLYYSVDKAIDELEDRDYPRDLKSVVLITFTDGNDDGSLEMASNTSWTDIDYQKYVGEKIRNTTIQGHQLEAFSIGLKGKDIGDYNYDLFKSNLLALASDDNNASEVTNMSEVERALNRIIDQLQNSWFTKNVSVKINMRGTGDRLRFTLDKTREQMNNNPDNSDLWVEGVFSRDDLSLNSVEYHGFTSTSGEKLIAEPVTVNGKTKYQFTFKDLRDKDGNPLETGEINFWHKNEATPAWQPHTEFGGAGDVETETEYTSAAVMLVMDCSTSLGEADFAKLKSVVNSVIERLADRKSGVDDIIVDQAEDAPVEYYNLQGLRVMNPTHGIYIQRQGNKAKKIYVR